MLRINVPPTGPSPLTFADFIKYHLPIPSKGVRARAKGKNKKTVLLFDNEYEAVVYADQLEEIQATVSKTSPMKNIVRDLATAIRNDDTIRNYVEYSSIYTWLKNCVKSFRKVIKPVQPIS